MTNMDGHNSEYDITQFNYSTLTLMSTAVALVVTYITRTVFQTKQHKDGIKLPPHIPHKIPFLGNAVSFGERPIEFLVAAYQKYGPVFSFTMVGKTFTYLIGSEVSAPFFNSKNEDLNAEEVYGKLVTPVFGKGVAYDVPHPIFLEQKKILKTGLNIARFKEHIPMIAKETEMYFSRFGDKGQIGKEIRSMMNEEVAQLYWDLDGGFSAEAWVLPTWVPLPSFRKRDEAHKKVKQMFYKAITKRRESGTTEDDMLQTLLDSKYKSGRELTDEEISGMMIGLLMAGQHTSSSSGSWLGLYLAKHKHIQDKLYEEQLTVFENDLLELDFDGLRNCQYLDSCLKESLRLRPPIMTMMRMCKTPIEVGGYTIPAGHQVCVSPTTNQCLPDVWTDQDQFKPERFLEKNNSNSPASEEKFSYIPFGAGRHRCIGEMFAYVQIKTIWSTLLRKFEFYLVDEDDENYAEVDYKTMIHTPKSSVICYKRRKLT